MFKLIKLILVNRNNSIKNLTFLLSSVSSYRQLIHNSEVQIRKLITIRNKISNPVTELITQEEIDSIDRVTHGFFSAGFCDKIFRQKDLSGKLQRLWGVLDDIYISNPWLVVDCVTHLIEKKVPKKLGEKEKNEFWVNSLTKFIGTSKRVNTVTDFIFTHIQNDVQAHTLDVLSICGVLLSFVVNSQSHLYFAMENIKTAANILSKNYDIEDILSIESKVIQNTETISDIQAIRNAVSHGSFNIEYSETEKEYIVDFQSALLGYRFNRRYTGSRLVELYADYDKLRDIQGLLIRIAYLKATIKLFFFSIKPRG
jgi:hypothetical protein